MVRSPLTDNVYCDIHILKSTETERSSGWQPWYTLETLKHVFNVSSEYQGCFLDDFSVWVKDRLWMILWMGIVDKFLLDSNTHVLCCYQIRVDSGELFGHICQSWSTAIVECPKGIGKSDIAKTRTHWILVDVTLTRLSLEKNGRHFADDIFRCIFVNEKFCILIKNFTEAWS